MGARQHVVHLSHLSMELVDLSTTPDPRPAFLEMLASRSEAAAKANGMLSEEDALDDVLSQVRQDQDKSR